MADEGTQDTATPPEGGDGSNGDAKAQKTGDQQPEQGAGGDSGQGGNDQEPSWGDFLAKLPEDQQTRIKGKLDKLDGDLRRVRGEKRTLQQQIDELKPKAAAHDQAQAAQQSAEDKAAEKERVATQRAETAVARMVASEVKVLAAQKFADPEDAAAFLDASQFLGTDGEPDTDAIRDALDDLLSRKPHLGKPAPGPRPPAPNPAQNGNPAKPSTGDRGIAEARRRFGDRVPAGSSSST